jgi:serine/threonine protein kinase/Flp pilus assembly protein TadD
MATTGVDLDSSNGRAEFSSSAPKETERRDSPLRTLVEAQIAEMVAAMGRGERPRAEDFLARLPALSDHDAVRIIYEEASLRLERGETSVTAEFVNRFPKWRSELGLLIECKRLLVAEKGIDFPAVGEDLEDFHLLAELGHGAMGRTFLASQHSLAGRLVVLKVTPLGQQEHLSLARLQHMHIVPLYFEQVFPERLIRVMGMPYLGGASLGSILDELRAIPADQRTGRHVLDAIDQCSAGLASESLATGPYRKYLAQASYVQAICWVAACVADALQYAHDRGLVHLDVKPSNVLIAGDGQPMLLDFHLAQGPLLPGDLAPDRLGGTPGYVSPEQEAAMDAVRRGGAISQAVDGRSDIFSLGCLLSEAVGLNRLARFREGEAPSEPIPVPARAEPRPPTIRRSHLDPPSGSTQKKPPARGSLVVSPGLSDIIQKCLANEPAARYSDAASLALDLRRHLNDLPLRGVANRSPLERWQKWRRRSPEALPRLFVRVGLGLVFVAAIAFAIVHFRQRDRQVDAALEDARADAARGQYSEAAAVLQRGLELAGHLPAGDRRKHTLVTSLQHVLRAKTAAELHATVNLLRFRSGIIPPEPDECQALFLRGLEIWKSRDRIINAGGVETDPGTERQVRTDLVDLATILASLCTRRGPGSDARMALRDAFQILLDAETQFGPSPALSRDLRNHALAPGRDDLPAIAIPQPRTAWDHYELGCSYLRSDEFARAETEFRQSIALRPEEFWPYYCHGIATYRLGRYQDTVGSLTTAIALAPRTAECYYNRALAYQALGRDADALDDDSRALELDPRLASAALNRGSILFRAGQHERALADFARARSTASSARMLGVIHYDEALCHIARKDWPAARISMRQAIALGNDEAHRLKERVGP